MTLTAADCMGSPVHTVTPDTDLPALERELIAHRVSGFPVVEDGRLVGVVGRSDVVRQICIERTSAEQLSDCYCDHAGFQPMIADAESFSAIAESVGTRIDHLRVRDVMATEVISVAGSTPLAEVARIMVERGIHRLPVVDEGRLEGIVSALDVVRLVAEGRIA